MEHNWPGSSSKHFTSLIDDEDAPVPTKRPRLGPLSNPPQHQPYQTASPVVHLPALRLGQRPSSAAGSNFLDEEEPKLRRKSDAMVKRTLKTKEKPAPAPAKRKRAAAPRKSKPKDKDFVKLLEKAETAMGHSGGDRNGNDVEHRLDKYAETMIAAMEEPNATWNTRKNAVSGIIQIFMAILCAPPSNCARHNRNHHFWLARNFLKAVDNLTVEERKMLAMDKDWMLGLEELFQQAKSYCVEDSMNVVAVKQRLRDAVEPPVFSLEEEDDTTGIFPSSRSGSPSSSASALRAVFSPATIPSDPASPKQTSATAVQPTCAYTQDATQGPSLHRPFNIDERPAPKPKPPLSRAPWYPITLNKIVVSEDYALPAALPAGSDTTPLPDESFDHYASSLSVELGSKDSRVMSEKTIEKRADAIVKDIYQWAGDILQAASEPRASEGTKFSAANTLLRMCVILEGPGRGFDTPLIHIFVKEHAVKIDQHLMRLVQRLGVKERRALAGWGWEVDRGSGGEAFLPRVEGLIRSTRKTRVMKSLEVVRDLLLEASIQAE